jgi:TRAP-type C4-dicarboxylate transport system substrate-binding protein
MGSGIPAKNPLMEKAAEPFLAQISKESGGSMNWKLLAGSQVISMNASLDGLKNSLVDAAFIIPVFQRTALINNNVLFDAQYFDSDVVQVTGATVETILFDCPECLDEYRRNNGVYLGAGFSATPFNLICKSPVRTLDQIKGLKVRATGASTRFITAMAAIPVNLGPAEMVQAVDRGAIDCAHAPYAWLRAYGLIDVAKNVLEAPMGTARALTLVVMNRKVWNGLAKKDREIIFRNIPMASARATLVAYVETDREVRKDAVANGVKFFDAGKDVLDVVDRHAETEKTVVPETMRKQGAKDPERLLAAYLKNLAKWKPLAAEIGDDMNKYISVFRREIFDRVDVDKL